MNDCSWMYRVSIERLCRMDDCNMVEGFINYTLSNLRNISGGDSRCPCKRCKNRKISQSRYCYNTYSTKRVHGEMLVLVYTRRTICSLQYYGRNAVWSTTNSSNVHEVIDDNSNRYRSMVMNKIKMN